LTSRIFLHKAHIGSSPLKVLIQSKATWSSVLVIYS
jgi:hypothetical protein